MQRSLTFAALLGGVLLAHASAHAAELTPAARELAAAAQKEGEMVVMWSSGTLGGPKGAAQFESAINKTFGINIKIKWTPGDSMPAVGNLIATTAQNKQPAPTDAYIGFSRGTALMQKYDLFEKAPWKSYFPDRLNDEMVEKDIYVKVQTATTGFSYNKALAPSVPEKMEDFLKPEWKGKFATTNVAAGFDQLAAKEAWGRDKTLSYAEKFSAAAAGFMRCNESQRLASGEFLALVMDCNGDSARNLKAKGAPLERKVAPDIPLISFFYLMVPKNAAHPNLGKLFVAFSATAEGQAIVREHTSSDVHLFPDSIMLKEIQEAEKKAGVKFASADIAWQETNDSGNQTQTDVQQLLIRNEKK